MAVAQTRDNIRDDPPAMDYPAHQRQYQRFLHLLKWFVIHFALLIPALYFYIIAGQGVAGTIFLVLGLGALGYGIVSTGGIARDVEDAIESGLHRERVRE